jgi:phenylpyruvate tautomerase PptA (4-oxalocrotonate tautomerase family)
MPMLDATIPAGALTPEAEKQLMSTLTDVLLQHEGADPQDPRARAIAWIFLHRPEAVFIAGAPAAAPVYRIGVSVPEGQFDDERRAGMVAAVTDAVLDAEGGSRPRDPNRVWVFANEVPDGTWGGAGRIARLADIATLMTGDREKAKRYAAKRIRQSREARAIVPEAQPV